MKRITTLILALLMLCSIPLQAFAEVDHNNLGKDKAEIINKDKPPVKPAKLENGQTAEQLIKNPDQPAIYTLRTDYKVQRGEKYEVDYQPYIASVGEAATEDEQKKVNKTIELPDLAGYEKPDYDYEITYDTVKNAGNGKQEFRYKAKANEIKIKHVFQDMSDFTKYTNPGGEDKPEKITTQSGNTGSTMEVSPLNENERKGFLPEAPFITMQVPENSENFILEYRYNRGYYNVVFDTKDGTPIPTRTYYFDQEIPKIESIPTKIGCEFLGWKPSHDLQTTDGKTYKKGEIINKADGTPALDLDVKLKMPALLLGLDEKSREKLTFTAVWKDKEKANYAIQFWAEKADHADNASILEKYEYMGTRVHKDADTGSRPNLDEEPVKDIVFPDLDQARLQKIWNGEKFYADRYLYLNKFFVYNKDLTAKQNADPDNARVVKSVSSTGKTVYNIYYDRQVYELYFTKSNALGEELTFYPEIYVPDGNDGAKLAGGPGNLYHFSARFNQLMLGWPNDAMQTKGFDEGKQSYGWGPNYGVPNWPLHLDTPPYRLNADEFLDMTNYENWGGYVSQIDKGDGTYIDVNKDPRYKDEPYKALSFGIKQDYGSMPHHMDFWMDGFKPGETIIRYDLYRSKADTNSLTYGHKYSHVQGFTPYGTTIEEGSEEKGRITEDDIDALNEERGDITPYPDKDYTDTFGFNNALGQMVYRKAFFNNADPFGDPDGWEGFDTNGYIRFKYKRNKYPLRFNYDPAAIKGDDEFGSTNSIDTFYEFPLKALSPEVDTGDEYKKENPANLLDNPENLQTLGLKDLVFNDPNDNNKLKVKRPDGLSDQMVFKGWALDPAGTKLIWENPKETMPTHALNLYAKWGEPDYKWKVTFDPNGGTLKPIRESRLTTEPKTIQEGDIGQEEVNTYPKKETNEGDKQIFTVIQRQKLVKPINPVKKGYDFLGWEVIRYKKDGKGDYTDTVDTSYRDKYSVPELYTFGNDVVSPIYLKAIWNPNQRVDVRIENYILDENYNLDTTVSPNPVPGKLENKRAGYLVATTGDMQGEKYILAPHEDLDAHKDTDVYAIYKEYNDRVKLNNSFFQTFRVEPAEIPDPEDSEKMIPNPDVVNNVFKFFYRPFRQREYKVNYIDERFKDEKNEKDGAIIGQEIVKNGNRHYDARNYRQIPGWVLTSAPQQQLFFDVDENTNALKGINGTESDEITFYYKDVRVIEVPKDGKTPDGYVRVTFKADKGGSFTDKDGKSVTELNYDVIKGLKSDLLPVPKMLEEGKTKEAGKYYITPDTGKKFTKWDKPLLNDNTIINEAHEFTAYFEWSGLTATGLVRTEAFKDSNGTWTNDFAPKIEDLKKQLVWKEKDEVKDLPAGTTIEFFDEDGNKLTKDEDVFKLVKEQNKADKDEVIRTVNVKAKVTFTDGKDPQELDIPITVYKNVYEALNKEGHKPLFLTEAEGKDSKDGGLKDVTGDYVMVTIKASKDFDAKDDKIYYVNKNAWVVIPEVKTDGSSTFVNWTADKAAQNEGQAENGIFNFGKRHKFTESTVISPSDAKDVVEQTDPNKKPPVPDTFVKVIVKTTDKATTESTQTFWVNPTKEVTIPVANPTGKSDQEVDIPKLGKKKVNYVFNEWQKVKTGEADDKLTEVKPAVKVDLAKNKFTDKVTVIEAAYFERFEATPIVKPIKTETLHTPEGKEITDKDLIDKITPPENKEIESITVVERPDPSKPGKQEAKVTIKYKDGSTQGTNDNPVVIPVEVHKNIIPEAPGGQRPKDAMENYVKVIFKAGEGGTVSGDLVYYVSPEVEVDMTDSAGKVTKTPSVGYFVNGEKWTNKDGKAFQGTFDDPETEFVFNFDKSDNIVVKIDENTKKPEGYVTVKFIAGENGEVVGGNKIYYVNPEANIKLVDKDKATQGATDELIVPEAKASDNYGFAGWVEGIDYTNPIKGDREHVAKFTLGQVTLTYKAGEGTGTVPEATTVNHGTKVRLARPDGLTKDNSTFAGWKLDGDETIYQPGAEITLEKARTATAQWTSTKHKVTFNTMGGTDVPSQEVVHGGKLETVTPPTLKDKVFMGWKEQGKENEEAYFDLTSAINEDKTLIAQWQDPVQTIEDGATVEDQFIKVTFLKGSHGTLKEGQNEGIEKVTYKVAKGLSFDQAKDAGLKVPVIAPNKYYKAKTENFGWDKELKLEGQNIEFTAQYEPEADVIPVDPEVTDEEQIEKEKPEGMVLVEFKVDDTKAFMIGNTKFYVKANKPVNIETPVVHPLTLDNEHNDYVFKGWSMDTEDEDNKVSFESDTEINDSIEGRPDIQISRPMPNANNIIVSVLTDGADGYLEITGDGIQNNTRIEASKRGRMNIFYINKAIGRGLKRDDVIKIYAVKNGIKSEEREYRVR